MEQKGNEIFLIWFLTLNGRKWETLVQSAFSNFHTMHSHRYRHKGLMWWKYKFRWFWVYGISLKGIMTSNSFYTELTHYSLLLFPLYRKSISFLLCLVDSCNVLVSKNKKYIRYHIRPVSRIHVRALVGPTQLAWTAKNDKVSLAN